MVKPMKEKSKLGRHARLIIASAIIVGMGILVLGGMSLYHLNKVETAWEGHNENSLQIINALSDLNREVGYGGFIHNFKNLVLRRDLPKYQPAIESNLTKLKTDLDKLDSFLGNAQSSKDIAVLRATFSEYEKKYHLISSMIAAGKSPVQIDAVVKVSDENALLSMSHLVSQISQRALTTERAAQAEYSDAITFLKLAVLFSFVSVVCLTGVIFIFIRRISDKNEQLLSSQRELSNSIREYEFLQQALDAHAIVSATDAAGNIVSVNSRFLEISGYPREELIGRNHRILKSGLHDEKFYQDLWDTVVTGKTWHGEVCNRRKDSSLYWVHATIMPLLDSDGLPERYISIRTDITELKETESRLAFAIEGAGDGVWDWNMQTGEMLLSGLYEAMLGYRRGEITQTIDAWIDSVHPDDLARVQSDLQSYLDGKAPSYQVELRLRCKDESYKWILCRGTVVGRDISGKPVRMIGIHSDIEQRKLAERQLVLFREMIEHTSQPMFLIDVDDGFRLAYVNQAAIKHWEADREELLTWRIPDWDPSFDEQRLAGYFSERLAKQPSVLMETQHRLKSGRMVPVEVLSNTMTLDGKHYIFGSFQNIEARKQAESNLISAKEAAERANKAKTDFLSSMSHELRTPMNAILGFAQLMEGDSTLSSDQHENLQQISKAGWHLLDLINEVLDLARVESGEVKLQVESVRPGTLIADCLSLVNPLAEQKRIVMENTISQETPSVRADHLRLKQVLINLLSNAIKYNKDGGSVVVGAAEDGRGALHISIRDTGRGMAAEEISLLFEPFTRFGDTEQVQGTGIGLSICKKLIERMGGKILVESTLGIGSVFSVVMPISSGENRIGKEPDSARLSLLSIEDDPAQQSLLAKWADRNGWGIMFAPDAASGIDMAMTGKYNVILLDIDLPGGFSGYDVKTILNEMESLRDIPVIGVSVHGDRADFDRARAAGFTAYLAKPVDLPELERVIQRAIQGGAHV